MAGGLDTGQSMDIMANEDCKTTDRKTERQREEKSENVGQKMDPGMAPLTQEGGSPNTNIESLF